MAVRCWGIVCGLALVKFGNPVIMEGFVSWPADGFEWLLSPWPLTLGYGLVALALGLSLRAMPGRRGWNPRWLAMAPAAWLAW
ncbi:MAG: hypothetical protein N2438_03750, partial [Limisphaera sp.]|nr:hypothetical protein [Limisphaera sp.]